MLYSSNRKKLLYTCFSEVFTGSVAAWPVAAWPEAAETWAAEASDWERMAAGREPWVRLGMPGDRGAWEADPGAERVECRRADPSAA